MRFRLFNRLSLEGLYVEDYHGDTLFYARNVVVPLGSLNVSREPCGSGTSNWTECGST